MNLLPAVSPVAVAVGLLCATGVARACDPAAVIAEVTAADEARYVAMVDDDFPALDRLLADDLIYTHSSALVDTKKSYVASLQSGKVKYVKTDRSSLKVTPYGCIAIVTGRGDFDVTMDGNPLAVQIRFTNVWEKRSGGWQMIAWQATRIPPKP
ncbi:MAG: nuclear transport factor 2 family protein [Burkholderiales bacterium]|jgi:ketosteroid isomerase-like protein|nr:nuclear transport factor 2 family protein [Burkholderiales bacterium]